MNELFKKITAGITIFAMIITLVPASAFAVVAPVAPADPAAPAPAPVAPRFARMAAYVDLGATGVNVRALQAVLVAGGHLDADAAEVAAGRYGEATRDAVVAFKRAYETEIEAILTELGRQLDAEGRGQLAFTPYVGTATMRHVNVIVAELNAVVVEPPVVEPSVRLSPATLAPTTLPQGAQMVPVLTVDLTAGTEDLAISRMTFRRTGVGVVADWPSLYLFKGDTRLTDFGRVLSPDTHEVEFVALGITIPAGVTRSFTLRTDVRAVAGGEGGFNLVGITSTPAVLGLPVVGNMMRIGTVGVSTATVSRGVALTNPVVGARDATIASFRIRAGDNATALEQVAVTLAGTIRNADFSNLRLYHGADRLAVTPALNARNQAVFVLTPALEIPRGIERTLTVRADLGGRRGNTIQASIATAEDIIAVDRALGFGAVITLTGVTVAGDIGNIHLLGGTIVMTDLGPVTGNIVQGTRDVVLTRIGMTADRNLDVRGLTVNFDGTLLADRVSNLRLRDAVTGEPLMTGTITGALPMSNPAHNAVALTGAFTLVSGVTRNVVVTVDVAADAAAVAPAPANTIRADIVAPFNIRDIPVGDVIRVEDIVPATIVGDFQTIVRAAASAALIALPTSATVITGERNVGALGFNIAATGAAATLNALTARISASTVSTFAADTTIDPITVVTRVALLDGATVLGTAPVRAGGVVRFEGLNLTIPADTIRNLSIQIDVAAGLPTRFVAISIVPATDISLVDADRNSITPSGETINPVVAGFIPTRFVTILTSGTLTVASYPGTPVSAIIPAGIAGTTGVPMVIARLDADREAMNVQDVRVDIIGTPAAVAARARAAVSTIELFYGGSVVATQLVPTGVTSVTFTGLNINVPVVGLHNLTARANILGVGFGATSGDGVRLDVRVERAVGVHSGLSGIVDIPAAPAIPATATITVPAAVIPAVSPFDLVLNIDGVAITLAYGDTPAGIATKIRAAVNDPARVPARTVDVTGTGAELIFTDRTGAIGTRVVPMLDREYSGGVIPVATMAGGLAATPQADTGTITAAAVVFTIRITPVPGAPWLTRDFTHTAPTGATVATIATALATAVNADVPLPITASVVVAGLLLTADVAGPAGGFTSSNLGPGVIVFATAAGTPAAAVAAVSPAITVPATVIPAVSPFDLVLNIDGVAIPLAYGDTPAAIAGRIRAAIGVGVVGRTVDATGTGAAVIFTDRTGAIPSRVVPMADRLYSGGEIPVTTMTGGAAAVIAVPGVTPVAGHSMTVRQTVPTVTKLTNDIALAAAPGDEVLRFTVAANAAGDVTLRSLRVTTTITSAAVHTARAIEVFDGITSLGTAPGVAPTVTTAGTTQTVIIPIDITDLVIAAGTSRTLTVRLDTAGLIATGDRVTASIAADLAADTAGLIDFNWGDGSITAGAATVINNHLVPTFPIIGDTLRP